MPDNPFSKVTEAGRFNSYRISDATNFAHNFANNENKWEKNGNITLYHSIPWFNSLHYFAFIISFSLLFEAAHRASFISKQLSFRNSRIP